MTWTERKREREREAERDVQKGRGEEKKEGRVHRQDRDSSSSKQRISKMCVCLCLPAIGQLRRSETAVDHHHHYCSPSFTLRNASLLAVSGNQQKNCDESKEEAKKTTGLSGGHSEWSRVPNFVYRDQCLFDHTIMITQCAETVSIPKQLTQLNCLFLFFRLVFFFLLLLFFLLFQFLCFASPWDHLLDITHFDTQEVAVVVTFQIETFD